MAGEIASAYIALLPTMRGFGSTIVQQGGPQIAAAGRQLGEKGGVALGASLGGATAKGAIPAINQVNSAIAVAQASSQNWLTTTAAMAVKNVALYGSMYAAIQGVRQGVSAMFDAMVGFNAEIEQAQIGFTTLLGSSSAAQEQMGWIKDFAKETPFRYDNLVRYSQQLLALGFNAEESRQVLEATGDAAAALGRGEQSIERINLALGQMWTKGKVQSQEMLQLTEAGIGAWAILAEAYGMSVGDVQDAVTAGLISATDAVPALIEGMNARFGGLMEKQAQTYAGVVSNIQDTLQQELAESGEPLFRELTLQAQRFLDALDDPEVLRMMRDTGTVLAAGAKALATAAELAWEFRDAIVAVGVGIAGAKLLSAIPVGSIMHAPTIQAAATAQRAYAAGLTRTSAALAGASQLNLSRFAGIGQVVGLAGMVDGYTRVAQAGEDATASTVGLVEAVGSGALAGAAFGTMFANPVTIGVGAAAGAIVGLTGGLWSMSAAMQAANDDTTLAQQVLRGLGVEATLASLALQGVTNDQIAAAGGFDQIAAALRAGTYDDYVAGLQAQSDALHEQIDAMGSWTTQNRAQGAERAELAAQVLVLDEALTRLGLSNEYVAAVQEQVVFSAYQAAYAADLQTGALGATTEAAWLAIVAEGGLGEEALRAAVRMEGLAGVAGFVTQMISGIPTGTAINFTTNASAIANQIIMLQAAASASFSSIGMTPDGYERKLRSLQSQYASALSGVSVGLSLPSGGGSSGGGGGGSSLANAAAQAAQEAARKLEQDRTAQLRFGDAFGSLMEAALEGNFDQYRERLEAQITSLTRDGYQAAADTLKLLSGTLTQASLDYAVLTNKLKSASSAQSDLTSKMRDQYDASVELIRGLGKVTDAQSFDQLRYLLGETASAATQYQDVLQALRDEGLSEDLWNQLAQAGPESMGLAQSILAQGAAGVDQLNSLSGNLMDAADSMGDLVSQSMYKQGVDAMQAYIEGLQSQATALENQLETIANNVLNRTAGAITPGNAGYSLISAAPSTTATNYVSVTIAAKDLDDFKKIQDFLRMLDEAPTTQLVNQAGTVTS